MESEILQKKINVSEEEKKDLICKALDNGWQIRKVDDKTYSFKRKKEVKESKKEVKT